MRRGLLSVGLAALVLVSAAGARMHAPFSLQQARQVAIAAESVFAARSHLHVTVADCHWLTPRHRNAMCSTRSAPASVLARDGVPTAYQWVDRVTRSGPCASRVVNTPHGRLAIEPRHGSCFTGPLVAIPEQLERRATS